MIIFLFNFTDMLVYFALESTRVFLQDSRPLCMGCWLKAALTLPPVPMGECRLGV